MVYRLEGDKLDERSADAIFEVLRRREDASAIVVGGGHLLDVYVELARRRGLDGRVAFTGYVAYEDLPSWFGRMTCVVAPVHTESFGQISVFAMGMELPVVGYRVGALPEVLGDAAPLVDPGDADALADALVAMLEDPGRAEAVGSANRRRAEERFSLEQMLDAYRGLYRELSMGATASRLNRL